jgi:hypothetical protein
MYERKNEDGEKNRDFEVRCAAWKGWVPRFEEERERTRKNAKEREGTRRNEKEGEGRRKKRDGMSEREGLGWLGAGGAEGGREGDFIRDVSIDGLVLQG